MSKSLLEEILQKLDIIQNELKDLKDFSKNRIGYLSKFTCMLEFADSHGEIIQSTGYLVIEEKLELFGVITCRHCFSNEGRITVINSNFFEKGPFETTITYLQENVFKTDLIFIGLEMLKKELLEYVQGKKYLRFEDIEAMLGEKYVTFTPLTSVLIQGSSGELLGKKHVKDIGSPFDVYNDRGSRVYLLKLETVRGFSGSPVTNGSKIVGMILGSKRLIDERTDPLDLNGIFETINKKTQKLARKEKIIKGMTEFADIYFRELENQIGLSGSVVVVLSSIEIIKFLIMVSEHKPGTCVRKKVKVEISQEEKP